MQDIKLNTKRETRKQEWQRFESVIGIKRTHIDKDLDGKKIELIGFYKELEEKLQLNN